MLKWAGIAALAWIVLSFLAFAVSAQIQKSKLADGITDTLDGNPFMLAEPADDPGARHRRALGRLRRPDEAEPENCLEAMISGRPKDGSCKNPPYRSDTIMLIRAGRGTFRKLSIPRDTLAEIPGQGPQKINSAYASGGAKLAVRTVEGLLGLDVDQVAIIDFDGFRSFIDTIGGIDGRPADRRLLERLRRAPSTSTSRRARTTSTASRRSRSPARARTSAARREFAGGDVERAQFQQLILDGIKGKLTSITALPMNFIKGPLIGWNAPKAMVSSMGALTMPQLVLSAAIGGGGTDVLEPSGTTGAGNLVISPEECERAAEKLLGEKPPRQPNCPQG